MEEPSHVELTEEQLREPAELADEYAVVEIFGHRSHAGRISEVDRFGAKMLRIDVPNDGDFDKGYVSHFYGGSSIFSLTGTDLATVKRMNTRYRPPGYQSLPAPDDEDLDASNYADNDTQ